MEGLTTQQKIVHLHRKGLTNKEIAYQAGCSNPYVSKTLNARCLRPNKRNQRQQEAQISAILAAEDRGISVNKLRSLVWKIVCEDDLFSAILDDGK